MNLVHAKMLAVTLVVLEVCGCGPPGQGDWVRNRVQVLNQLRDDINAQYGFLETNPRVNRGPCGRFADAFRERWNARFREKVNIAFLMATNTSLCAHIVIKFPDGSYFDGGNGVMSEKALLKMCPDCKIEVMTKYDRSLLNSRCENVKPVSSSTLWSAFIPRNFTRQSGSERPAPVQQTLATRPVEADHRIRPPVTAECRGDSFLKEHSSPESNTGRDTVEVSCERPVARWEVKGAVWPHYCVSQGVHS